MNLEEIKAKAIEIAGCELTLEEALKQWELEREAIGELYDENEAHSILARRFDTCLTLAIETINALEMDGALFMSEKTRARIAEVRDQYKQLKPALNMIREVQKKRRYNVKAT